MRETQLSRQTCVNQIKGVFDHEDLIHRRRTTLKIMPRECDPSFDE